jgi:hypothetical protein
MVLTWTFYPKYEKSISLTIKYVPVIDKSNVSGFLHVETNRAWVGWDCFKAFNQGDVKAKKEAFDALVRIDSEINVYGDASRFLQL